MALKLIVMYLLLSAAVLISWLFHPIVGLSVIILLFVLPYTEMWEGLPADWKAVIESYKTYFLAPIVFVVITLVFVWVITRMMG